MPSPIAAIDLIKNALRKIGAIATGETPSADMAQDALGSLNDVLERWSIENLAVYGSLPETFATVAGQSTYTMGIGGNWNTDRPTVFNGAYITVDGFDYTLDPWDYDTYATVGLKTQQQPIVQRYVFINDTPLASIILWPVPSRAVPITVDVPRILTQIPTVATTLILPPGYVSALQYNLAAEMAPDYGSPIDVTAQARGSLALIKRANRTGRTMTVDQALMQNSGTFSNFIGGY